MMRRLVIVCALTAALASAVQGGQRYTEDNDPVDLGGKALSEGRLPKAKLRFEEAVAAGYRVPQARIGLAEIAVREGRLAEAETGYRHAAAEGGDRASEARAGLGVLLLRLGRTGEAASEIARALELDDDNWTAHYGRARLHLAAGAWEQSRAELAEGRDRRGVLEGEDKYRHGQALLLQGTGDLLGAEQEAQAALRLNPTDVEIGELVSRIYLRQGKPDLAIQAYEQALAAQGMPRTAPLMHQLGNLYRADRRTDEARDRYLQAVAIDSTYAPVLGDLGNLLSDEGRHELAARIYLRYVAAAPADTSAWVALSASLFELRRFDQARDAADKARQLDPADEKALFAHIRAGIRSNDPAVKQAAAAQVAALPPLARLETMTLVALADWQSQQQRYDDAAATLARAAALDPADPNVPFQTGIVALRRGDTAAAAADFRAAIALNPDAPAYHLNLGIALYQAGLFDEAIPTFRHALELREDLTAGRLLLAQVLAARNDVTGAEAEYRRVLTTEPENAKALRGLGYCLLRGADYADAAEAYRAATALDPDNADGWAGLGSAELGRERLDAAETAFARARQLDPSNVMLKKGAEILDQARNKA